LVHTTLPLLPPPHHRLKRAPPARFVFFSNIHIIFNTISISIIIMPPSVV